MDFLLLAFALVLGSVAVWMGVSYFRESGSKRNTFRK